MPSEEMITFVIYDTDNNKLNGKIRKICANYGLVHIQYSVAAGRLVKKRRKFMEDSFENLLAKFHEAKYHLIILAPDKKTEKEMLILGEPISDFQVPVSMVIDETEHTLFK